MEYFFSGWFVVNILAPMLLPVAGIVPLMLVPVAAPVKLMATVKDGQLCWAAVAMGAASLYESWVALEAHKPTGGSGILVILICCLMLPAMVLAAAGSVFSTPLLAAPAGGLVNWCSHYKAFVGSGVLCTLTAIGYTFLHSIVA
jgi:hypothetical protein